MALRTLELCAGVGMLGEGLRAGFGHLGIETRTVCHVEREAYAAAVLAARIQEGSLDAAPVWSDILTFDARAWRGAVDCIVAGFPCQDLSVAGRRAGLDGQRSGLFFRVLEVAGHCGAWLLFLENVSGIASATASVVDETQGLLEERAASRVVGELADSGWDAEWITLSASDVGASHGRARWFCLAWRRVADAGHGAREEQHIDIAGGHRAAHDCAGGEAVDDAERVEQPGQRIHPRPGPAGAGAADAGWASVAMANAGSGELSQPGRRPEERSGAGSAGNNILADAECQRWPQAGGRPEINTGRKPEPGCRAVAHACGAGCEGRELCNPCAGDGRGSQAHGSTAELRGAPLFFAPGPADLRWSEIIYEQPVLAPALEPGFRRVVNGLAFDMDDSRAARLRCIGNGVVAASAAAALVELVRRANTRQ